MSMTVPFPPRPTRIQRTTKSSNGNIPHSIMTLLPVMYLIGVVIWWWQWTSRILLPATTTQSSLGRSVAVPVAVKVAVSPPVIVHVYVEALCSDSKAYFERQLMPTYETLGAAVMDLKVVVYGNAQLSNATDSGGGGVQCQHGPAECDANSYAQCAADVYQDTAARYVPFVACLFDRLPMGHASVPFSPTIYAACAKSTAVLWSLVRDCHMDAPRVWALQQRAAAATIPSHHTYVPWVTWTDPNDGEHHIPDSDQDSLLAQVCRVYVEVNGGMHPACDAFTTTAIS